MSEPKRQHTVPKSYLAQFIDPNTPEGHEPFVWIFERGKKIGKKKAPNNILKETHIYTIHYKDGGKDYTIEKNLSQIEGDYATIFREKISKKLPLTIREHITLCVFTAAMFLRTTAQRENVERNIDQLVARIKAAEEVNGVESRTSQEWEEFKKDAHRKNLIRMTPALADILFRMNTAFLIAPPGTSFITSDNPCYLFNARLQWQRFMSPGFAQKYAEVGMSLSPEIAVYFSWVNNLRGYLGTSVDSVHEINRMIYRYSHEHFVANSPRTKRRWFLRFPLDPIFIGRIIGHHIYLGARKIKRIYANNR